MKIMGIESKLIELYRNGLEVFVNKEELNYRSTSGIPKKEDIDFLKKYKNEIKAYRTEKLIGAGALRDYDFRCLPGDILETLDKYPPFEGYHYKDEVLYARIKIGDVFFSIPPVRDGKQM